MRVLVVDDSKVIRMLVAECANTLGHEVIHTEGGDEAIEYIKENEVDLILMDVEMPGKNGFETTLEIRQVCPDEWFPIIFLSTKHDDDSFANGILSGGDAYMLKPINPLRLQLTITALERIYVMRQKLHKAQKELLVANKELEKLALYDQLTGLANRRNFDETLSRQFKLAQRNKTAISVIICDIDFFKLYNDSYGHQKGDQCLAEVAQALGSIAVRPTDKACRYGGEEFTLVLPETNLEGGLKVGEKLIQAVLAKKIKHEASKVAEFVTMSCGLATHTGQFEHMDELVKAADDALYAAKENGRNRLESH